MDQLTKKSGKKKVTFEDDSDGESITSSTKKHSKSGDQLKYRFKGGKEGVMAVPVQNQPTKMVEMLIKDFLRLQSGKTQQAAKQTFPQGPVYPPPRQQRPTHYPPRRQGPAYGTPRQPGQIYPPHSQGPT